MFFSELLRSACATGEVWGVPSPVNIAKRYLNRKGSDKEPFLLRYQDSNLDWGNQNPMCCHYTIPQSRLQI
jgi:hypothetical protein